ncbi:MAG TPA: dihydroorotate dehydrogenase [Gemmatimonadaceae bacterium]
MNDAPPTSRLAVELAGLPLQNPLLLASGTAGYGRELDGVIDLDSLGGLVTKAVSVEPRPGASAPRVAEFPSGMINAVGLANPGVEAVRSEHLPWLAARVRRARIFVNVVGSRMEHFAEVVSRLDGVPGAHGFELNVSCPNVRAGGMEFGADEAVLAELVRRARQATALPLFVKLSPALPDIARTAAVALDAGANGLTLVNTMPGLLVDLQTRRPALGFGSGGVSGGALLPVGLLATSRVYRATKATIIGAGGIASATDALQYVVAGATAFAVGTAAMRDPRLPRRLLRDLASWCEVRGVRSISSLTGTLEWPS